MVSIVESVRAHFDAQDNQAREALQAWESHHLFPPHNPVQEFCLQTAFMQFVHAYLLRVCEEYAMIPPFPDEFSRSRSLIICHSERSEESASSHERILRCAQNDIASLDRENSSSESSSIDWLDISMKTVLQLLSYLDNSVQANFASSFDWFAPDEQNMLTLYRLLRPYHLKTLDADILGKIYNEGFIEQRNRSEKGQFYTPPHIVNYVLDTLQISTMSGTDVSIDKGYRKYRDFLSKTIADLSCGSGSFLMAAAARKRAILQQLVSEGEITCQDALSILTGTTVGFDLNPFACYLATINLLIQCLPFLIELQMTIGRTDVETRRSPLQFSIYCLDALDARSMEQIGLVRRSFDYLVGNPPYVSATESSSNLLYRNKIWNSGHYRLLNQKWDLFVPFFERNLQLLQAESGRLGLIVSSGIETEGYAQQLREELCQRYRLLQIDFFPGLRVFPRTGIESTIVYAENRAPDDDHIVRRRRHTRANLASFETLPSVQQLVEREQVFRWRYLPTFSDMEHDSIPLCAIAYIGTGIEAQSSEHAELLISGQRQKRFTLYDVFVLHAEEHERPAGFSDDGVVGNDVDNYYLRRTRYVAYESYRPSMRGPRHPALFRTPEKLLLGETSGGYYDTGQLFTNHSVQVVVPWHALAQNGAIEETGIARVLHKSQQISGMTDLAALSQQFDLRYILAILNSRFMRRYLAANMHQGTRKGRIYPDIWKRLPIKMIPLERQKEIALLVEAVQEEYKKLVEPDKAQKEDRLMKVSDLVDEIEKSIEVIYGKNTIQIPGQ